MKKVIYVVIVLAVLLALAYVLRGNQASEPVAVEEEVVAVESDGNEEAVVVVDTEPVAEEAEAASETDETVVEENPEQTADEGETIVEE